jgi:uncharacterized membrane protein YhaH (DUF805 family)
MAALFILTLVPLCLALTSIGVRRLHDRGKTGRWLLLYYATPLSVMTKLAVWQNELIYPVIGLGLLIWAFVELGFRRGEPGTNTYRPNPPAQPASD